MNKRYYHIADTTYGNFNNQYLATFDNYESLVGYLKTLTNIKQYAVVVDENSCWSGGVASYKGSEGSYPNLFTDTSFPCFDKNGKDIR